MNRVITIFLLFIIMLLIFPFDKIFFTDMTSIVIMKKYNITNVITEDDHFKKVGLGLNPLFTG